ncbi:hypothetical protein WS70_09415 [Burkholderia mayonis]|uniref:Uncharacterized protein n=1 Tax=Burkholderia mayonis TaxID=1385591 RepID=A0A1B4FEF8_9BURK|nr:hypothetical protein WS70_09415 [Burkholderia mayonis]KVE39569.1 hypothetical protein WS69_07605 [Burkholderia sp. BDU5]KVE43243.1 hypothetical protein WS70_10035 [Burkholderia mayonis]
MHNVQSGTGYKLVGRFDVRFSEVPHTASKKIDLQSTIFALVRKWKKLDPIRATEATRDGEDT